jgi:hypothetical protein
MVIPQGAAAKEFDQRSLLKPGQLVPAFCLSHGVASRHSSNYDSRADKVNGALKNLIRESGAPATTAGLSTQFARPTSDEKIAAP